MQEYLEETVEAMEEDHADELTKYPPGVYTIREPDGSIKYRSLSAPWHQFTLEQKSCIVSPVAESNTTKRNAIKRQLISGK